MTIVNSSYSPFRVITPTCAPTIRVTGHIGKIIEPRLGRSLRSFIPGVVRKSFQHGSIYGVLPRRTARGGDGQTTGLIIGIGPIELVIGSVMNIFDTTVRMVIVILVDHVAIDIEVSRLKTPIISKCRRMRWIG